MGYGRLYVFYVKTNYTMYSFHYPPIKCQTVSLITFVSAHFISRRLSRAGTLFSQTTALLCTRRWTTTICCVTPRLRAGGYRRCARLQNNIACSESSEYVGWVHVVTIESGARISIYFPPSWSGEVERIFLRARQI